MYNFFNSFLILYLIIASEDCQFLRVRLKNNALTAHEEKQDTYQLSSIVNGRPSWISISQAIWYIPQFKNWAVGPLESLGTTNRGISSRFYNEADDPKNIKYWDYYKSGSGWISPEVNDIIIECKYKQRGFLTYTIYVLCILYWSRDQKNKKHGSR